jgi:hypothetical protein
MFAPFLLALAVPGSAQAQALRVPGLVALVGEGGRLDVSTCAELSAGRRVLLCAGDPGKAPDPLAAAGSPAWTIALDPSVPHAGDEREPAERARSAGCIVLTGGSTLDWFKLLEPNGSRSNLSHAIREAHAAGATVVGAGSAAPYLAEWAMIDRSTIDKPQRNPRRERADVAVEGLGLLRGMLVDSSACPRGDPARVLRAAFDGHLGTVLFLDGPATWIGDPKQHAARVCGTGTLMLFDLSSARWQRETWREGRFSILSDGDRWTARDGAVCAEPFRADGGGEVDPAVLELQRALARISARLSVRIDERTRVRAATGGRGGGVCELVFDLEWETR